MAPDIDVYRGNNGLGLSQSAGAGQAGNFDDLTFDNAQVVDPFAVPTEFTGPVNPPELPDPSQALSSGLFVPRGARRRNGQFHRLRTFWHVHPSLIVVSYACQELTEVAPGKLKTSGPWLLESQEVIKAGGAPQVKLVTVDDVVPATWQRTNKATATLPSAAVAAAEAQSMLPAVARTWLNQQVPVPELWLGGILRWVSERETVDVLRADKRAFAVVHADRKVGSDVWKLTRVPYTVVSRRKFAAPAQLALES